MPKYLVLSFDDGTIYDRKFIEILNKYNISATFNLNSGLENFVWYYKNIHEIKRLTLSDDPHLYDNHEIASHTLTHPFLTELSEEELINEVNQDVENLERVFNVKVVSLGTPFDRCTEREIEIIKKHTPIKYFRIPILKEKYDYTLPSDPYHIGINALYGDKDIYERVKHFAESDVKDSIFVIAGHSYDFEMNNHWEYIEELIKYLKSFKEFEIKTFKDALASLYNK